MSADGYERDLQSPSLGPPWMHGPWGNRWWKCVGKLMDEQNDLMRAARKACMPEQALAMGMDDALDRIGDDRLLPRGGTAPDTSDETSASYAARLKKAWTTWGQDPDAGGGAGSVKGILTQLKIASFPVEPTGGNYWTTGALLVNHIGVLYQLIAGELSVVGEAGVCINRQTLTGTTPGLAGWTLDARDQFYSKWMLLFLQNVPVLDNTACPAKARLNQICHQWKSGSATYCGAAIVPSTAKCIGWPSTMQFGDADLVFGTNGMRFIDPE